MLRSSALAILMIAGMTASAGAQSAPKIEGTYEYSGTESDGSAYGNKGTVEVKAAPSGAFELLWDGGDYKGVGQIVGNSLAVASVAEGKNTIMIMEIKADGSIAGKWCRRTDSGTKGTEVWTKK